MLDILSILDGHGIAYRARGKNVKQGNIVIRCPYCSDDPDMHLGISLITGRWGCWRNNMHKGGLRKLLGDLCGLDKKTLDDLLGAHRTSPVSELRKRFNAIGQSLTENISKLAWPKEFELINTSDELCRRHVKHLIKRGYAENEVNTICKKYDLRYVINGPFAFRVNFPLTLVKDFRGWTGRDITGRSEMRYRTEAGEWGKNVLYLPSIKAKHILLLEGPFDALKANWVAFKHNLPIRAGAFTGTSVVEEQIDLVLQTMAHLKGKLWIGQDYGATANTLRLRRQFSTLHPGIIKTPEGFKDLDEMDEKSVVALLQRML